MQHPPSASILLLSALVLSAGLHGANAGARKSQFGVSLTITGDGASQPANSSVTAPALRYTCGAVRHVLLRAGFQNPQAQDCSGAEYSFSAILNGQPRVVRLEASSGRIVQVR